jgi:hypothetical protein
MSWMTYLCSPLSLAILARFGHSHFQEMQNSSHISSGQYALGRTVVTERGSFSVPKWDLFTVHCTYSRGPPTVFALICWGHRGGIGPPEMQYIRVTKMPVCVFIHIPSLLAKGEVDDC